MQKCLFPTTRAVIAQTPGVDKNGNAIDTVSHQENKAIDISPSNGKFYAPCDIECIFHQRRPSLSGLSPVMSVFISTQSVQCADGYVGKILIMCTHGGEVIQLDSIDPKEENTYLAEGESYIQGQHFYTVGTDLGKDASGNQLYIASHIHMDVKKGSDFIDMDMTPVKKNYYLKGDCFVEDLFYKEKDSVITFSHGSIPIDFVIFGESGGFNPSGKPTGWYKYNGDDYYVVNEKLIKGWIQLYGAWFYLDYTTGAMKTGWAADGSEWYYMNPDNGHMVTGWLWDEGYQGWYFLNPNNGGAMQTYWLTDGGKQYYLGSDGKMYKNCRERINGVWYTFDNSGVATQG